LSKINEFRDRNSSVGTGDCTNTAGGVRSAHSSHLLSITGRRSLQLMIAVTAHNLLGSRTEGRVVASMFWRSNITRIGTGQNVKGAIAFHLQVACAHLSTTVSISVSLLQLRTTIVLFIVVIDDIEGSTALIFLACVEVINLVNHTLFLELIASCQLFKSVHLPIVPFLSKVSEFLLLLFELLCTHASISNSKVLVKTFAF